MKTVKIKLYTSGKQVEYNGEIRIIDHILVRRCDLLVYLVGETKPLDVKYIKCDTTIMSLEK